jgi:hypothetical protein
LVLPHIQTPSHLRATRDTKASRLLLSAHLRSLDTDRRLGIYSYFPAVHAKHDVTIPAWEKAVEGMSGAAVLYTIPGVIFTLCLGGIAFFGFLGTVLDIAFVGCFAAIAYYTRYGANSCRGIVNSLELPGRGLKLAAGPADLRVRTTALSWLVARGGLKRDNRALIDGSVLLPDGHERRRVHPARSAVPTEHVARADAAPSLAEIHPKLGAQLERLTAKCKSDRALYI